MGRTRKLNSTSIDSIRRVGDSTLIHFHGGKRYLVLCPKSVHRNLLHSQSPGAYYNKHIRPKYQVERVVAGSLRPFDQRFLVPAGR